MHELKRYNPFELATPRFPFSNFFNTPFFPEWDNDEGNLPLDVYENDDGQVVVRAPLPGFKKEDIDVQINNGVLTIKAECDESRTTTEGKYQRRECRWGSVRRTCSLPGVTSADKVIAEFKDGVLELRIPQTEAARAKKITIR